jgi:ATP-dependent Clp protease adaptor protein ClpS
MLTIQRLMADTEIKTRPKIAPNEKVKEPSQYRVIYMNDEVTTMEFVVETLKNIFYYDESGAEVITQKIHEEGSAVVAVLPYEIAEQKGVEVTLLARSNGFPLSVKLEIET